MLVCSLHWGWPLSIFRELGKIISTWKDPGHCKEGLLVGYADKFFGTWNKIVGKNEVLIDEAPETKMIERLEVSNSSKLIWDISMTDNMIWVAIWNVTAQWLN